MELLIRNGMVFRDGAFSKEDLTVSGDRSRQGGLAFDFPDCVIFPGFTDVHVHLREPGFSYKETIRSGTLAGAHGGYVNLCAMPNVQPAQDSVEHLQEQLSIIRRDAAVRVFPYGTITVGEKGEKLIDMEAVTPHVIAFSDDGRGVQDGEMMREAMQRAKVLGKIIAAHCEDEGLPAADPASEWKQVQRDLGLAAQTGCAYHVCHVSCKESVALVRQAKALGVDVTCETAPHYLLLSACCVQDDGRFRMNPPLRGENDRQALLEGLRDGTIDMIATDHAPHAAAEKAGGFAKSLNGVVGLETAFPALYTGLVKTGEISLEMLVALLSANPTARFGLRRELKTDFTVFDLNARYTIDPADFLSMGRSTPFEGMEVYGRCLLTVCGGRIAWQASDVKGGAL